MFIMFQIDKKYAIEELLASIYYYICGKRAIKRRLI